MGILLRYILEDGSDVEVYIDNDLTPFVNDPDFDEVEERAEYMLGMDSPVIELIDRIEEHPDEIVDKMLTEGYLQPSNALFYQGFVALKRQLPNLKTVYDNHEEVEAVIEKGMRLFSSKEKLKNKGVKGFANVNLMFMRPIREHLEGEAGEDVFSDADDVYRTRLSAGGSVVSGVVSLLDGMLTWVLKRMRTFTTLGYIRGAFRMAHWSVADKIWADKFGQGYSSEHAQSDAEQARRDESRLQALALVRLAGD